MITNQSAHARDALMSPSTVNIPYAESFWVVPNQFLAGEHPADADESATIVRLSALLDVGIRTFIDLTEEQEMAGYHQLLRTVAENRRIDFTLLRIPIPDRGVPWVETLRCILDVIDCSVANANPVFVHCFAGIGRTGTVVGCYLQRHGLATSQDVLAQIAELRRRMPSGREASPHTFEQVRMVENWQEGA